MADPKKEKVIVAPAQTIKLTQDMLTPGDVLYVTNKLIGDNKHGKLTLKVAIPDTEKILVKDKKGKETKKEVVTYKAGALDYVVTGWRVTYLGTFKKRPVFKLVNGTPPKYDRKMMSSSIADLKNFSKEKPKKGKLPDRKPIHIIYTIEEEEEEEVILNDRDQPPTKTITHQYGYLTVGYKTTGKFEAFDGLDHIKVITSRDPFVEKKEIHIQIPTAHEKGRRHNKRAKFGWIWFRILEFPTYWRTPSDKEKDPYTRFLHVGGGSAGCLTLQVGKKVGKEKKEDYSMYAVWDKLFEHIAYARNGAQRAQAKPPPEGSGKGNQKFLL